MKLQALLETRKRVFIRYNGENKGFLKSKSRSEIPFVVVFPLEKGDTTEYFTVAVTKTGLTTFKQLSEQRYRTDLTGVSKEVYDTFLRYAICEATRFDRFRQFFDTKQHRSLASLYRELMEVHRISPGTLEHIYGPMPEMDSAIPLRPDILLYPTESANKKTIQLASDPILMVDKILKPKGLHGLVAGRYRLARISGKAIATYSWETGWITLDIASLREGSVDYALIHELGHKWEDKANLERVVREKFVELRRAGHRFGSIPDLNKEEIIIHTAKFPRKLHGRPFAFMGMNGEKAKLFWMEPDGSQHSGYVGVGAFSYETAKFSKEDGSRIEMKNEDPWFPTAYGMTNPREFFAELFVRYISGETDPEVTEWFDSLPRPEGMD